MPEPRGKPVSIHVFFDSDNSDDKVTRQTKTGVLIFIKGSPILWFSKKQNSVQTSTFGSDLQQ